MVLDMEYEELPVLDRQRLEILLASDAPGRVVEGILSASQHDPDMDWVTTKCLEGLDHANLNVKMAAITGLGHIARVHKSLDLATVLPKLRAIRHEPGLEGRVSDALDDIEMFVPSPDLQR